MTIRWLVAETLLTMFLGSVPNGPVSTQNYTVLLHSRSLENQRAALKMVIADPGQYSLLIQQSLRQYPQLLRTDPVAANRAVYISALVRDQSFAAILVRDLGNPDVLEECVYPCPIVFALTVDASFAGWKLPPDVDSRLTTVEDLRSSIRAVSQLDLRIRPIQDVVQGPELEKVRSQIEGKTEQQLIQLAGPTDASPERRLFAAFRLETSVSDSEHLDDLYLLALNELRDDSGEYRSALYKAIYRAELAKTRGL